MTTTEIINSVRRLSSQAGDKEVEVKLDALVSELQKLQGKRWAAFFLKGDNDGNV